MDKFVKELIKLTGLSRAYAVAKWYGLDDYDRTKPILAATAVARQHHTKIVQ